MITRTYNDLIKFKTLDQRYEYLKLNGKVCEETFGFDRWMNQIFYKSDKWKEKRHEIIIRDNGCDLGLPGYDIKGSIYVHHMNPFSIEELLNNPGILLLDEYLICTSFQTHQAIHYGNKELLPGLYAERFANDTCPWKL